MGRSLYRNIFENWKGVGGGVINRERKKSRKRIILTFHWLPNLYLDPPPHPPILSVFLSLEISYQIINGPDEKKKKEQEKRISLLTVSHGIKKWSFSLFLLLNHKFTSSHTFLQDLDLILAFSIITIIPACFLTLSFKWQLTSWENRNNSLYPLAWSAGAVEYTDCISEGK